MKKAVWILLVVLIWSCSSTFSRKDHSMHWQKNAAEYKALCIQAYNIAQSRIDEVLQWENEKPLAIIADIDETVLNNRPYNEMLIEKKLPFTQKTWSEWVNSKKATPIPGARSFFQYAHARGVEIIYISNRRVENYTPTKENLIALGFPFDQDTQMLLRDQHKSKEERRKQLDDFNVVLLLGDNLADFDARFDIGTNEARSAAVDQTAAAFGTKFILFPNLIYGTWEEGFD